MVKGAFTIPLEHLGSESGGSRRRSGSSLGVRTEFVADSENALLTSIQLRSQLTDGDFCPLVLCGPTGVGKSFLAHGLVGRWANEDPLAEVVTCTGADFARLFREAVDTDAVDEFRRRFREADILLLDDVHELAGKDAAQVELASAIDELRAGGRVILITSPHLPTRLNQFLPQLISRLMCGLIVPLKMPGAAARRELILRVAQQHELSLDAKSLELLVRSGPQCPTGINGLLLKIRSDVNGDIQLDEQAVRRQLEDQQGRTSPTISTLTKMVARRFKLRVADLKSSSRRQAIVRARGAAMYLARRYTDLSLERLGEYFGKRDHTTVLHACRQVEQRVLSEPELKEILDDIENQLAARMVVQQ